jgi:ElaB/YqjD/DUF883 family membrane-anchored ribosome-binding protein
MQGTCATGTDTLTEKATKVVSSAVESAKEAASTVAEKAREAASSAMEKTSEVASTITQKAEDATTAVVDKIEAGGRYVRERGTSGMVNDLGNVMRRHPIPTLAIGFTFGFLLASLRRR